MSKDLKSQRNKIIHLNNAGASLVSEEVLIAQIKYLREEAQFGGYETAARYHHQLEDFYNQAAQLINASPKEIAFTESATVAWQRVFFSVPFKKGDIILTTKIEYASNYISFLHMQKEKDIEIQVIPGDASGEIDISALRAAINEKVRLISITHIPTNGGIVNPAEEIGKIANEHKILYLLDACQSVGQYPVNVKRIGCDFLSVTGRKYLRGPRGTGFLYVSQGSMEKLHPQNLDLHSADWIKSNAYKIRKDARRFETWECNLAGKLGLTLAIRQVNEIGIKKIWDQVRSLADYLRSALQQIEGVTVRDLGREKCGIVTFTTPMASGDLKNELHEKGFNTSVSVKNGTRLDMSERNINEMIRASVHYYNTTGELDDFIKTLQATLNRNS